MSSQDINELKNNDDSELNIDEIEEINESADCNNLGDAFADVTKSKEFSNLMGSLLGNMQNSLNNSDMSNLFKNMGQFNNPDENDDEENSSIDSLENLSDVSENNSDILECNITQSELTESINNVNFKITELGNMLHNLFTDSDGNTIAEILSGLSKQLNKN